MQLHGWKCQGILPTYTTGDGHGLKNALSHEVVIQRKVRFPPITPDAVDLVVRSWRRVGRQATLGADLTDTQITASQ